MCVVPINISNFTLVPQKNSSKNDLPDIFRQHFWSLLSMSVNRSWRDTPRWRFFMTERTHGSHSVINMLTCHVTSLKINFILHIDSGVTNLLKMFKNDLTDIVNKCCRKPNKTARMCNIFYCSEQLNELNKKRLEESMKMKKIISKEEMANN